jgi:hypothetical protein
VRLGRGAIADEKRIVGIIYGFTKHVKWGLAGGPMVTTSSVRTGAGSPRFFLNTGEPPALLSFREGGPAKHTKGAKIGRNGSRAAGRAIRRQPFWPWDVKTHLQGRRHY